MRKLVSRWPVGLRAFVVWISSNLAITTNARGGPGIVLASVAFDAGIISSKFYTTLVVAAVLTSQIAGAWLDYVLRKGWPLLTPVESDIPLDRSPEGPSIAYDHPESNSKTKLKVQ